MLDLTIEQKVLLNLISGGITGREPVFSAGENGAGVPLPVEGVDWESVIVESKAQAVLLLACDSAAKVKEHMPTGLFEQWKAVAFKSMMNNMRVQNAQKDMVSIMAEKQSAYVILKGQAAAHYYPRPELRALGDVDFLIDPEMQDELSDLFVEKGYSKYLENHACHVVFRKPGAHLEMHFEPSGIPNGQVGEHVRGFFEKAAYRGIEVVDGGMRFAVPEPLLHGMILALHMQHHQVSEGLGIRHLCDWACFVDRTAGEDFWEELLSEFDEIGLLTYIRLMTKTCALYLGIALPEWAADANDEICEEIIKDIFAGGNFGRKDDVRSKSGMMVSNHGKDGTSRSKLFYLYQTLHKSSAEHDPSVKDSRVRWFAADFKRAVIYLKRTIKGERVSLLKMMPEADKRRKIYEEFHLFETKGEV